MSDVGFLSVTLHRESSIARVRVDGVDVSARCYAAHDGEGWADCFVKDGDGHFVVRDDGRDVSRERLRGQVVIDFPKGLD